MSDPGDEKSGKVIPLHQGEELTTQQQTALEALASGSTLAAAARTAGVSRRTLHRWRAPDHPFRKALDAELGEAVDSVGRMFAANARKAAETILSCLDGGSGRDGVRLAAAKIVLERVGVLVGDAPGAQQESTPEAMRARVRAIYGLDADADKPS